MANTSIHAGAPAGSSSPGKVREILESGEASAFARYRALTYPAGSTLKFWLFELATMFLLPLPGGLGIVLRRKLLRPFFGTGVLGGFTTFSTYVVDVQRVAQNGAAGTALAYLLVTILAALAAVYLGTRLARLAVGGLETEAR